MGNLRRYLRLTILTFGLGWLAIAGIPPLSGFWAKGDVLDNAFARYKPLWAIGLVTAALTAYYMTRLVVLAFSGDDRWRALLGTGTATTGRPRPRPRCGAGLPAPGHGIAGTPHESPPVMVLPLVVLAVLALFGGALNLPWHTSFDPLGWLRPVFGSALFDAHQSSGTLWTLGIVDAVVALAGLGAAFAVWPRRTETPPSSPPSSSGPST